MGRLVFLILCLLCISKAFAETNIFGGLTSIKDPFSLRDPFAPPVIKSRLTNKEREKQKAVYENIPKAEFLQPDEIVIVGILTGKNRVAVVRREKDEGSKNFFTLKEGMKIGENKAEVKAILPGGVILVERITNIYGDNEYIETVIPLSK